MNAGTDEFERLYQKAILATHAEKDPSLRRHIEAAYKRHRKAGMSSTDAHNAILEEMTGPFSHERGDYLRARRTVIGKILHPAQAKIDRAIGKKSGKTEKWEVRSLDVWGNARDGFEVNDSSRVGSIEIPEGATDRDVLKILRDENYLSTQSSGLVKIDHQSSDESHMDIVERRNGKPVFQLSKD